MARNRNKRPQPLRKARKAKVAKTLVDMDGVTVDQTGTPDPSTGSSTEVFLTDDNHAPQVVDPAASAITIPLPDGNIEIDLNPQPEEAEQTDENFDDNLAVALDKDDPTTLWRISSTLLEAIDADLQDCAEWVQQRTDGLELLAQKVEKPGTGNIGQSSTAVVGQSTVRDSLLAEAVDTFQANAFAELCPSAGPVKVMSFGTETPDNDQLAMDLEIDLNYYMTGSGPGTATEYYPDTRRMLWWTGYASGMFKKVYACPLRRRPVSESVDGSDLIVPSNSTDLRNAGRITHRIQMRPAVLRRMQLLKVYRDVALTTPVPIASPLQQKEATITGMNAQPQRTEDQEYTIYEVYCELDLPGYEHKDDKGNVTGLPLPYRVTLDKDSRTVLEVRRNWEPDDTDTKAKIPFVAFPYTDNMGIYGTGLLHRLGNYTMALTAMLRECIDAGMFASFPGFLYAKPAGRQLQSEFRVPPGGGAAIDVSAVGNNINNAIMPLPYKDVSSAMVALMAQVREIATNYAGMANQNVSEGKQDAPVGTTLALIEQATKIVGGVHKALHSAQKEEFRLLKELFKEDPEALWRGNRRPRLGPDEATRKQRFMQALEDCELVPASDPNVPSQMHRLGKANALLQVVAQAPQMFNLPAVFQRWASMMKIENVQDLLAPPQQPQPDPQQQANMIKQQEVQQKQAQFGATMQLKGKELAQKALEDQAKQRFETLKLATQHSQAMAAHNKPETIQPPDPFAEREIALKEEQVRQKGQEMHNDAFQQHADRESEQTVKAMDLASRLATHPEAQPEVNSELQGLSSFLTPTHSAQVNVQGNERDPNAAAAEPRRPQTHNHNTMPGQPPAQMHQSGGTVRARPGDNIATDGTGHALRPDQNVMEQIEYAMRIAQALSGGRTTRH